MTPTTLITLITLNLHTHNSTHTTHTHTHTNTHIRSRSAQVRLQIFDSARRRTYPHLKLVVYLTFHHIHHTSQQQFHILFLIFLPLLFHTPSYSKKRYSEYNTPYGPLYDDHLTLADHRVTPLTLFDPLVTFFDPL
jgi:hypothetical protein